MRDKEGQAAAGAKVTAKISGTGGKSVSVALSPEPGAAGRYDAVFDPPAPGSYQFEVAAQLGDAALTADRLAAEVGRQNLEFEKLDLDDKLLARLAAYTKGRYLHISSADLLLDQLDRSNAIAANSAKENYTVRRCFGRCLSAFCRWNGY